MLESLRFKEVKGRMYEVKNKRFYFFFALVIETDFAIIFINSEISFLIIHYIVISKHLPFDMKFLTFDITVF